MIEPIKSELGDEFLSRVFEYTDHILAVKRRGIIYRLWHLHFGRRWCDHSPRLCNDSVCCEAMIRYSDGDIMTFNCNKCGDKLMEPGAILFGPPDAMAMTKKIHLCVRCFREILLLILREPNEVRAP